MISVQRATHGSQLKTPAPSTRVLTWSRRLPQKLHLAVDRSATLPRYSSEHLLDRHRDRTGDPLDRHQVVDAGVADAVHAAECPQQGALAHRAQAGHSVQRRGEAVL